MTAPEELRTARLLLRSLERADVPAMVHLAGATEIASTTLNIPHPYAEHDALSFLEKANEDFRGGRSVSFAISISPGRELCGAIGLTLADAMARGTRLPDRCGSGAEDTPRRLLAPWSNLICDAASAQDLRAPLCRNMVQARA
jgi:hypothetical protein